MDTQVKQTNTTEVDANLAHADIISVLGLAVMLQAGIDRDQPGTVVTASLVPVEGSTEFTATIHVVVDHNFVPPAPEPDAGTATGDASLKSDCAGQPVVPPAPPAGGLQIPSTPVA